ncbi:hypothetical protein ANCCEY_00237 [Ancylostoma ceylanicum]|uniref:Uncharacterized protein n=1 Tax=Ancylostoma ceylanicum TaxID=53326 RepID=A0A0D6M926_9BILA|nr:hypothetical protein ANCCEY_00237 [Ancylostoma ceylanicum]
MSSTGTSRPGFRLSTPTSPPTPGVTFEKGDAYGSGKTGLQLDLTRTTFMKNGWVPDAPFSLNGTTIFECSSYVYLGREVNMMSDLAPELGRRKRGAWGAYKSIKDVVKKTKNTRLRAHLFDIMDCERGGATREIVEC